MADAPMGNPASAHCSGAAARVALETARATIAQCLGAFPDEVIFTSGATESNNLAIFSMAARSASEGGACDKATSILASPIEHPSVLEPCRQLALEGSTLIEPAIDTFGHVVADSIPNHIDLIALQLANHETGVIQDIANVRQRFPKALFHTDATQAVGKMPVHFHRLGVSTLACSAHKFHGPAGIGILLVDRCIRLKPRSFGGHQQQGIRPGTEPVALAVGFAAALKLAVDQLNERSAKCQMLRQQFLSQLHAQLDKVIINGDSENGLPHTINVSFLGCSSETLFIRLDLAGIDCSTGSACSSGSMLASPVLRAMHVSEEVLRSSIRFSLSHLLSEADVVEAAKRIVCEVKALRKE